MKRQGALLRSRTPKHEENYVALQSFKQVVLRSSRQSLLKLKPGFMNLFYIQICPV